MRRHETGHDTGRGRVSAPTPLTEISVDSANAIYNLLVLLCDANESERHDFVQYMAGRPTTGGNGEWRFRGKLGFGGKFYVSPFGWRVDYYPEDKTLERDSTMKVVNERLRALALDGGPIG